MKGQLVLETNNSEETQTSMDVIPNVHHQVKFASKCVGTLNSLQVKSSCLLKGKQVVHVQYMYMYAYCNASILLVHT